MVIKRYKVSDGVFVSGRIEVDLMNGGTEARKALKEILYAASRPGRIEKIESVLPEPNGDPAHDMRVAHICELVDRARNNDEHDETSLQAAEMMLRELRLLPLVQRDDARQKGTTKARRPEIDEWIDKQLAHNPYAKSPELWANAPEWITDQIAIDRFKKRVTKARKRRK